MARIFLCYRSGEGTWAAMHLDYKLSEVFGEDAVFRASRSIPPGETYADAIMLAVKECEVMLVLICPNWVDRLVGGQIQSWVRTEVAAALENGVRVIPVLLGRTPPLVGGDLPPDLAALAEKQYLRLDNRTDKRDIEQLVAVLTPTGPAHEGRRPVAAAILDRSRHIASRRLPIFRRRTVRS